MKDFKHYLFFIAIACFNLNAFGQCATSPTDMISWWQAENNANDLYGNYNGMEQNCVSYGSGVVNNAFYFDGIDNVVVVADSDDLDLTDDYRIEIEYSEDLENSSIVTRNIVCLDSGIGGNDN
jgi:hypothetical protein